MKMAAAKTEACGMREAEKRKRYTNSSIEQLNSSI